MSESAGTLISQWPVEHASAAVVGADGATLASYGDADRVYELASVTKLLTAYTCLIALEEGAFDLDDAAGPEGSTVRHLLAHTSGLDFGTTTVMAAPERLRIYSNAGFDALAAHLAAAADMTFADYAREAVLEPLGMTATRIEGPSGGPKNGAYSNVHDLARFAAELLAPTLVSRELFDEATQPVWGDLKGVLPGFGSQRPNPWGLGFEIRGEKSPHWTGSRNSPRTFGHFGAAGTFLWVDPDVQLACVALTDRPFDTWAAKVWPPFNDAVLDEFSH